MLEGQDFWTLLREEESSLKRKGLMDKLVKIVDYLWETKSVYKELTPERELQEVKKALKNSTFQFSSMYRSWIPKPNKPGKLRPITQPKKKADIIVMDARFLIYWIWSLKRFFCRNLTDLGKVEVLLLSFLKSRAGAR